MKSTPRPPIHSRAILSYWILCAATWTGVLFCLAFFALPYPTLKAAADHLSRDGSAKPFTPAFYAAARPFDGLAGLVLVGLGLFLLLRHKAVLAWLDRLLGWVARQLRLTVRDARAFFRDLGRIRLARGEPVLILVVTLIGAWLRLVRINFPMGYDEAYTYVAFASQPVWKVISDYHLPNNHIFHTLLVHVSTRLVGSIQPWAVRIPTFLSGVLVILGVYFLARRLYGRPAALIAACLVSAANYLVVYSAEARGYMLLTLLTLLAFLAGSYVLQHKNRLVWIGLVVICALGFFTVPIMLYAFGGLMAWLLVSALAGDLRQEYSSRLDFLRWWAAAGAAAAFLTLLLYTPVLVASGPRSLFANQFVSGLPWDYFLMRMQVGWHLTWIDWMVEVPPALQILLVAGFFAGLVFHRRISRFQTPTQLPMLVWIALVLLAQRSDTLSKLWVFLDTLFLIWAAAGLAALAGSIRLTAQLRVSAPGLAAGLALAVLCLFPLRESFSQPAPFALDQSDTRITMEHLAQVIQPEDMIVVAIPVDAKIQYYAMIAGIPQSYFYLPKQGERPFERAFLVVAPSFNQTPTSVLEQRMLEPAAFDLAGSDLESDFGVYRVYRVLPAAMGQ